MKIIQLYQEFKEPQIKSLLKKHFDINFEDLKPKEMTVGGFFGDYIEVKGYKFKIVYGNYICMATPSETHEKPKINFIKCRTDIHPNKK